MTSHRDKDAQRQSRDSYLLSDFQLMEGNVDPTRPKYLNETIIGKKCGGGAPTELMDHSLNDSISINSEGELSNYHLVEGPPGTSSSSRSIRFPAYDGDSETSSGTL